MTICLLINISRNDPFLELAAELEKVALQDEYFVKRKLYPNVDFYSGVMLRAMGIPTSMFTVLFAVARTVGWVAHWKEMISDPKQKIGRPRQLFTGSRPKSYVGMDERSVEHDDDDDMSVYNVVTPPQLGKRVSTQWLSNQN